MRYIYFFGNDNTEETKESNNKEELIQLCKNDWAHLSYYDRKHNHAYVLESVNPDEESEDHDDGDPVFNAKQWEEELLKEEEELKKWEEVGDD